MLLSRHIVVADFPDGSTTTLYQGPNAVKADAAVKAAVAEGKADAVVVFHHPAAGQVRFPRQDRLDAAARSEASERAKTADADRKQREAVLKRDQAKKLVAEAKRLDADADALHKEQAED